MKIARKKCKKCRRIAEKVSKHHIDGLGTHLPIEAQNNKSKNLINLCDDCHNQVEGVCSECGDREYCNTIKFKECWRFEDSIPPIHFISIEGKFIERTKNISVNARCSNCDSKRIKRISVWMYTLYRREWGAIYNCKKCNNEFHRVFKSLIERDTDIKNIPIEVEKRYSVEGLAKIKGKFN